MVVADTGRFLRLAGLALFVALSLSWLHGRSVCAEGDGASEYQVKAAFLYNFTKFVDWPDSAFSGSDSPYVIGVVGSDPFGALLDRTVEGKTVGGRPFVVKRFHTADEVQPCHVLFVSDSETSRFARIRERLGGASVLTVGENGSFLGRGGVINFVVDDNRVRFEVNLDAAAKNNLSISSKLLALARGVRPRRG